MRKRVRRTVHAAYAFRGAIKCVQFKGLRCTKTSALNDYLPTEEENNRKWFKNVPNQSHYDKLTEIHHVVSNTKKQRTEADIPRLCPETVHLDGSNQSEGNV